MASFVESATLAVKDDSTKNIDKINASLKKLYATAKRTAKALNSLDFEPKGLNNAARRIGSVTASLNKLGKTKVRPTLDLSGINSQLGKISSKNVQINVTANMRGLQSQLNNSRLNVGLKGAFEPLRGIGKEIARDIQQAIITGIARGIKDGYSGIDVAETRMTRQSVTPANRGRIMSTILDQENRRGNVFDRGQLMGLASEAIPLLNDDLSGMDVIIKEMSRLGTTLVGLGKSAVEADDGLNKYNKVAEQSGRMYNRETGQFDPAAYSNFMSIIDRAMTQFGKEIDANVVEQTFRALQGSKMSLNDAGIIALLGFMEETRSSAGVATNQLIKQLSGDRIDKKRMANLIGMGLVQTEDVEVTKKNGKITTEKAVTGVIDEELLRSNPLEWTNKYLLPKMVEKGLDPNNPTHINKFANMVTSDRTATSGLVTLLARYADFMRQAENFEKLDTSQAKQDEVIAQSGLIALGEAQSKVTTFLGLMATALESAAIPALNTFSSAMQSINEFIAPGGETSGKNSAIVAGGGIAAAIAAITVVKAGWSWLSGSGAQTAATLANTAALNANTAALTGNAVTNGLPGESNKKGGWLRNLAILSSLGAIWAGSTSGVTSDSPAWKKRTQTLLDREKAGVPWIDRYEGMEKPLAVTIAQALRDMVTVDPTVSRNVSNQIALQSSMFPGKTKDDLGITVADNIQAETSNLREALTTSTANGASALGSGIVQGAQTAAGILANAITAAAQNIRISAQSTPGTQIAPVDTGANPLSRHH